MSGRPTAEQGLRWIAEQAEQMNELRNGNTRDPGFRAWRQGTLTALQRIWPGQSSRAQRFKRIPFAPPSARATPQEARECFERGFAEARKLLKMWETELKHVGIAGIDAEADATAEPDSPLGNLATAAEIPPAGLTVRAKSGVTPPPKPAAPLAPQMAKAPPAPKPVAPPAPQIAKAPPASPASPKARPRGKSQLKDMLGFGDWAESDSPEREAEAPTEPKAPRRGAAKAPHTAARTPAPPRAGAPARPTAMPARELVAPAPVPVAPVAPAPAPVAPAAGPGDALGQSIEHALQNARDDASTTPAADLEIHRGFEGPMAAAEAPAPVEVRLSSAIGTPAASEPRSGQELTALARELESYSVPESERTRVALGLAEIAARVDHGAVTWESLQQATTLVMAYPALARRAVPLLLRHFDAAA